MYTIVFSSFGFTTFFSALTLRFVVLITSSNVRKDDCNDASSTRTSSSFRNTVLQIRNCCPPWAKPVRLIFNSPVSAKASNCGIFTPAMFCSLVSTLIVDFPTFSKITCLILSPDAHLTSVNENMEAFMRSLIDCLVSTMRFIICRNCRVRASLFLFNIWCPLVAPISRVFTTPIMVMVGATFSRCVCPDIYPYHFFPPMHLNLHPVF